MSEAKTVAAAAPPPAIPQDPLLAVIARAARDPKVDVDKMERLFTLMERKQAQQAEMAWAAAMAQAKGEFAPIVKNKKVDFEPKEGKSARVKYSYADFAAVTDSVDPALKQHGLSYSFQAAQQQGVNRLTVTCVIRHELGHKVETMLSADNDVSGAKNPLQAIGSAATYLMRYTLLLALGLASEDDDAQAASKTELATITPEKLAHLMQLMKDAGRERQAIEIWAKCKLEEMPVAKYQQAVGFLNKAIADKKPKAEQPVTEGASS